MTQEQQDWEPQINRKNVLGWLRLIRVIYPWTDEQKKKLDKFIHTRYKKRRDKLLDEIFGGDDNG